MKKLYTCILITILTTGLSCGKNEPVTPVTEQPGDPSKPIDDPNFTDYHKDGEVEPLYPLVDSAVNIVVLGDGFVKEDLKKGGNFDTKVKQVVDYLFTVAPFSRYKQYFNVYKVYAESKKQGAAKSYNSANTNTKFNSYFDKDITRLLIAGNSAQVDAYAQKALPAYKINLKVLVVNDDTYGGSGGSIAVVSTNQLSRYVMTHEIGHTFAGLGDEYVDVQAAPFYSVAFVDALPNVDTTTNPQKIKWSHYFNRPAYQHSIGAYAGAYYRAEGFYRPEMYSLMSDLNHTNYNAPSREAIARMIHKIIGKPFDLEAFVKKDAVSATSISAPVLNTTQTLPKNDFINMKQRLQELKQIRTQ